jgi:hypothetical protein
LCVGNAKEPDRKAFEEWQKRFPYGEQDVWGNDIAMLRANLRLTPLERLKKAEADAKSLYKLTNALRKTC